MQFLVLNHNIGHQIYSIILAYVHFSAPNVIACKYHQMDASRNKIGTFHDAEYVGTPGSDNWFLLMI